MEYIIGIAAIIYFIYRWKNKKKKEETNTTEVKEASYEPSPAKEHRKDTEKGLVKRFSFPVVGLNYDGRRSKLTRIINQYRKDWEFYEEPYDGITNREIKEIYFDERIYEITGGLDRVSLEKEDDNEYDPNAIKVLVNDLEGKTHHIGYVPKEDCKEIRELMDKYKMKVTSLITGGKYKELEYDFEKDKEVIKVKNSDYGLMLNVSFWEKE